MESEIIVTNGQITPKIFTEGTYEGTNLDIRYYEKLQEESGSYKLIIRHEEYLTSLKGRYQSYDHVLAALKRRKKALTLPRGLSSKQMIRYISKALASCRKYDTEGSEIKIYGPLGLRAASSVFVKKAEKITGNLTIETDDRDGWYRYETSEKTDAFPRGSIGDINGMNFRTKPLPDNILDVLDLVFAQK